MTPSTTDLATLLASPAAGSDGCRVRNFSAEEWLLFGELERLQQGAASGVILLVGTPEGYRWAYAGLGRDRAYRLAVELAESIKGGA